MKQRFTSLKAFFVLLLLSVGMTAFADEVTFTAGTEVGSTTSLSDADEITKDGVTISCDLANFGKYGYYMAANSTTTISVADGKTITKVVMEGSNLSTVVFTTEGTTSVEAAKASWEGSASSVVFTTDAKIGKVKTITVTYGDGGETPAATKPNLQMTYPEAKSKVTSLPDKVIFMFDQEIKSVQAAAIQHEYDDPIMIDADKISIADGNSVYIDITGVKDQITAGGITVYCQLTDEYQYDTYFTYADEFKPISSTFDAKGGQVVFNENVDFVDYATEATCNVATVKTKAIATQATLTLDDDNYAAINVEFQDELTDGDYTLDIPAATIMSTSEEQYVGGSIAFTVSGGIAKLLGVSPTEGENVNLETEYILTFSKPVKYTSYLSDITLGQNPFGNGDGATFWQNDDKTEIHAKLDASTLAMYGVTSTDQAAAQFGSSLALHVYGVKDLETGEALEYNDPDDEAQFTYNYNFGDPVIKVDPKDGATLDVLETVYFANPEGITVADGTQKITVVNGKAIAYQTTAAELTTVPGEYGAPDYYSMTIDPAITEDGEYTIQIPAGTFTLAGTTLNKYTEVTYTVGAGAAPATAGIHVDPVPGTVATLKDFTFTYGDNQAIMPSYSNDITITNEAGETVATISSDDMTTGTSYADYDEYYNPLWLKVSLATAITTPGTYTMNIPAGTFTVTQSYDWSEATTFTWTVTGGTAEPTLVWTKQATYTNVPESWGGGYGTIYTDDQVSDGMKVTVEKWSDNRLVIKNWFNSDDPYYVGYQDVEITYTDDPDYPGYYVATGVGGNACQGNDYGEDYNNYFYIGLNNIWGAYVDKQYTYVHADDESGYIYMYIDPYNNDYVGWSAYYLEWAPEAKTLNFTADPADGSTVSSLNLITLTFTDAMTADYNYEMSTSTTVTNDATGESATSMTQLGWGEGWNQITVQMVPVKDNGKYTVTIPAGAIIVDNVATTEDIVLHYTVGTADGINSINASSDEVKFNVAGQRVNNAKGIIIKNGKKYLAK